MRIGGITNYQTNTRSCAAKNTSSRPVAFGDCGGITLKEGMTGAEWFRPYRKIFSLNAAAKAVLNNINHIENQTILTRGFCLLPERYSPDMTARIEWISEMVELANKNDLMDIQALHDAFEDFAFEAGMNQEVKRQSKLLGVVAKLKKKLGNPKEELIFTRKEIGSAIEYRTPIWINPAKNLADEWKPDGSVPIVKDIAVGYNYVAMDIRPPAKLTPLDIEDHNASSIAYRACEEQSFVGIIV
jgi:hypothetical protein